MANFNVFSPIAPTVKITTTAASARGACTRVNETRAIRVYNDLDEVIFLECGDSTVVATVASLPIGPKATEAFEINPAITHIAAISAAGAGNVYFTEGQGA